MEKQTKPVNILLVEDSEIERELFRLCLQESKITNKIYETSSVNGALHFLQNSDVGIDLIITDIRMDGHDGFELLERIRSHELWRDIPVAVMSGHNDAESIGKAAGLGADGYIIKPITHASIIKLVKAINRLYWKIEIGEE